MQPAPPVHPSRIAVLADRPPARGAYVLYWMQASQRAACNHALEHAVARADGLGLPVVAGFGLTDGYPGANARHYAFLLEGLAGTGRELAARGIDLVVRRGDPPAVALALAARAAWLVCDVGCLPFQRAWRRQVADAAPCPVEAVESDVVVPLAAASTKAEWAARTLRPKLWRQIPEFLVPLPERAPRRAAAGLDLDRLDFADPAALLAALDVDRTVPPVPGTAGGYAAAAARLAAFVERELETYHEARQAPGAGGAAGLSAYLQFGQISPLEIALAAASRPGPGSDAFLEQLLVRRELAANYVMYTDRCDTWAALPAWARATLDKHASDPRPARYDETTFSRAATHDQWWNAAQAELVATGSMPGYLRMYWGKKILEWSASPPEALATALRLNDRFALDGRGANGIAGVAWCLGLHDRPWGERPVFGTVRSMTAAGLERKFDMRAYARRAAGLVAAAPAAARALLDPGAGGPGTAAPGSPGT